jgi:hypothetical protein
MLCYYDNLIVCEVNLLVKCLLQQLIICINDMFRQCLCLTLKLISCMHVLLMEKIYKSNFISLFSDFLLFYYVTNCVIFMIQAF